MIVLMAYHLTRSTARAASLDSDDAKARYTLGQTVGQQLGELNVFTADELDAVLEGIKDSITGVEPKVDLNVYAPKSMMIFQVCMNHLVLDLHFSYIYLSLLYHVDTRRK